MVEIAKRTEKENVEPECLTWKQFIDSFSMSPSPEERQLKSFQTHQLKCSAVVSMTGGEVLAATEGWQLPEARQLTENVSSFGVGSVVTVGGVDYQFQSGAKGLVRARGNKGGVVIVHYDQVLVVGVFVFPVDLVHGQM